MGLREILRREPISELELRAVVSVEPTTTVRAAVKLMCEDKAGAVIISDAQGAPVGMFTEKLLIHLLAHRPQSLDEPMAAHMSKRVVCLGRTDSIARLIATMQEHNLRWVCIVDDAGRPTALTGLREVIEYVAEHFSRLVKVEPLEPRLALRQREGA